MQPSVDPEWIRKGRRGARTRTGVLVALFEDFFLVVAIGSISRNHVRGPPKGVYCCFGGAES